MPVGRGRAATWSEEKGSDTDEERESSDNKEEGAELVSRACNSGFLGMFSNMAPVGEH